MPSKLPSGIRYPCPKDEALLVKMGLGSPEFQNIAVSCTGADDLSAKLKARLGSVAYERLKTVSGSVVHVVHPTVVSTVHTVASLPRMIPVEGDGSPSDGVVGVHTQPVVTYSSPPRFKQGVAKLTVAAERVGGHLASRQQTLVAGETNANARIKAASRARRGGEGSGDGDASGSGADRRAVVFGEASCWPKGGSSELQH